MVSVQWDARRQGDTAAPAESAQDARLADLRPGMRGQVTDIDESVEPSTARRLFDLGFAPGAEVTVLRKAPLGDPVVFHVADYEVALRKEQAAGIHVRRTA
ncbi:FeoA family protein [Streptomyces mexicanus]|uniref:Ferrous iron transport protein A n=1 Tax=Streptomyces mexicanus TaxID=178566 RepID=A0A7X1LU56_9ACTN|nr:FeoA family protein [Streptomyces mexicanus]MBC2868046.1 ferrous iron transport protein A [Streptomyces mexicanus]